MSQCSHQLCTGRHSGKWSIAELCPLAREKRRASWRAYDDHLHRAELDAHIARFGDLHSMTVVNPDAPLNLRWSQRKFYRYLWQLRNRIGAKLSSLKALKSKDGMT
jgi:hypothetical protein